MSNMRFSPIKDYWRREQFAYFSSLQSPFYAVTVSMDITGLKAFCKNHGYSLQANLCYLFLEAAMGVRDLMVRLVDDTLVSYECLHARSTVAKPGGSFGFATFPFHADIHAYNRQAARVIAETRGDDRIDLGKDSHQNYVFFSALTGIPFSGLTHAPVNHRLAGEPMVSFGKYQWEGERLSLPVGIQVNHALVDGAALNALYARLEPLYREGPSRI